MRRITYLFASIFIFSINSLAQINTARLTLLLLQSNFKEALTECNHLINKQPENPDLYYQKAIICKQLFYYPQAIQSIEKAIHLNPESIDYLSEYGSLLLKKEKDRDAIQVFQKVLKKDSSHLMAGIAISNNYMKNNKFEEAYQVLNNLYKSDSLNGYVARNMGVCSIKNSDSRKSIQWLTRAIAIDSTDIKAYEYLSLVYAAKKKYDLAIETLNKAISIDNQNSDLFKKLGDTHLIRNHNYLAVEAYLKAFEIDPTDFFMARDIGFCYFRTKNYEQSKYYLHIAEANFLDAQVYETLGDIYVKLEQPDTSIYYYNEALELLKPDAASLFNILTSKAESYYQLNDFKKAIESFEEALKIESNDIWIEVSKNKIKIDIASIYNDKLADRQMAIHYYQQVTKTDIVINKDYHEYAQQQIRLINEQLFFENKK